MSDIKILKPTVPENDSPPQKRKCCGVSCNVYNPLNVPLCELRIRDQLMPTLLAHDPASQWLHLWSVGENDATPVSSQFGSVPRGSVLSYQAPVVVSTSSTSVTDPPYFISPEFEPVDVHNASLHTLYTYKYLQTSHINLNVTHVTKPSAPSGLGYVET